MSNLDKTLQGLDELAERRKKNKQLPDIDFIQYMKNRESEHDNVKRVTDFEDEVLKRLDGVTVTGATMPWTKTHDKFRFRPSEVTMWHGFNGHKKSMVLGYISLGFIKQNEPVCIASFEMKPSSTISRMLRQASGCEHPTKTAFDRFKDFTEEKLWLYDKQGSITPELLYGVIYYCAEQLKVKHFVIDSLMRVVGGEDDYNGQKDFVTKLCAIALETNIHIHLVHHNRKGDDSKASGRYGAKGSSSLSDNVHNDFEVFMPKKEEGSELPDLYLICDKQREGEWQDTIGLWFEPNSLQFCGTNELKVRTWI